MQRQTNREAEGERERGRERRAAREGEKGPRSRIGHGEERKLRSTRLGASSQTRTHLELVPGVGMEAVPTAASQVQAGATQGLVRAAPADEAAAVIVPE